MRAQAYCFFIMKTPAKLFISLSWISSGRFSHCDWYCPFHPYWCGDPACLGRPGGRGGGGGTVHPCRARGGGLGPRLVEPTCSCSSASRVARSSSESELSVEEEAALLSLLAVLLLTTGGAAASTGSSGILAKRISKTSCRTHTHTHTRRHTCTHTQMCESV